MPAKLCILRRNRTALAAAALVGDCGPAILVLGGRGGLGGLGSNRRRGLLLVGAVALGARPLLPAATATAAARAARGSPGGRRLAPVAALCCPRVGVRPRLGLTRLLGPGGKRLLLGLAVVRGLLASLIGLGRLGGRRGLLSGLRGGGGGSLGGLGRLLLFRGGLSGSLSLGLGSGLLRQAALLLSLLVRLLLLLQLLLLPLRNGLLPRSRVDQSRSAEGARLRGVVSEASVTVRFVRFSLGLPARVAEAAAGDEGASLPSRDSEGDMARASGLMLLRHALSRSAAVGALSGLSRDS